MIYLMNTLVQVIVAFTLYLLHEPISVMRHSPLLLPDGQLQGSDEITFPSSPMIGAVAGRSVMGLAPHIALSGHSHWDLRTDQASPAGQTLECFFPLMHMKNLLHEIVENHISWV